VGWTYRKSVSFGPLRLNMSRSGLGYSLGAGGFRTGTRANGRRYTSVNLPGTGLTYRTSSRQSQGVGCAVALLIGAPFGLILAETIRSL
jgi:hypothetical protein